MGTDRSGAGVAQRLRSLTKPPAPRLYGRIAGKTLRARQQLLLDATLPRLRPAAEDPFAGWPGARWLEVGAGGGEHALAQIAAHPEAMLVACEVFLPGLCSLLSRVVPEGGEREAPLPANLRVWDDDARLLLASLAAGTLDRLFLLFPDPWPKARHAKRRFVHPAALAGIARVMRDGAEWRIATDDPVYQSWVTESFASQDWFDLSAPASSRPSDWPATRYEAKALAAGRHPLYWVARRRRRQMEVA